MREDPDARPLPVAEAIGRLEAPDAFETYSPLGRPGPFVVDLGSDQAVPDEERIPGAAARVRELPTPVVGWIPEGIDARLRRLAAAADVLVDSQEDLAAIAETVRTWPLASMCLVQLLRRTERLPVPEGLAAESLTYSVCQSGPEFARWLERRGPQEPPPEPPEPAVLVERHGDRLELTLNRPERRNAFSRAMRDALVEGLAVAVADPSVREVVLRGRGPAFSSGGDLAEFGTLPDPATAHAVRSSRNPARMLKTSRYTSLGVL